MRCLSHLILAEDYSPRTTRRICIYMLGAQPQNPHLQSERNFLNFLVLWSTSPSPFVQPIFWLLLQHYSPVRTHKTSYHSSVQRSNHSAPTSMILPRNWHVLNIAKLSTPLRIWISSYIYIYIYIEREGGGKEKRKNEQKERNRWKEKKVKSENWKKE